MATAAQNIDTAIANYAEQLADISANPKVSYKVGDQMVSWTEYQTFLIKAMADLQAAKQAAGGPFIVRARGVR